MRPIDADALMEECYKELEDNSLWHDEDTSKDYADGHDEGKRIMMAIIDQAPTIDVDGPQGEWIEEYHGNGWNDYWDYTCSNCGKKYERADAVLYKANFCPNCGARMKGADDE